LIYSPDFQQRGINAARRPAISSLLEQSDFHSCFYHWQVRVELATVRTNRCNNQRLCGVVEKWRGVVAGAVLREPSPYSSSIPPNCPT